MKRSKLVVISVIVLSLLLATVAFAQTFPDAGTAVTNAVLQNQGDSTATVNITYYAANGTNQLSESKTIALMQLLK
ncbi:MAG: hypothetical protein M5U34_28750 [Chloroflexi bacterium]|nr:hypothetical protein [Chloroflexota bacterium]